MQPDTPHSTTTERFAAFVVRRRWSTLGVVFAAFAVMIAGAPRLGFDDEYRVFFGPDNPQLLAFDEVESIYTKNDNILFVIEPPDGDAFSPTTLEVTERLTEEAWQIPFAIRVDSLSNFQHTWAQGDELVVEDLITGGGDLSDAERQAKRKVALAEPLLRNRVVPDKTNVLGMNVTLQLRREEQDETARAVAHARGMVEGIQNDYPGYRVRLTGMVMLNNSFQESAMQDMATLTPAMYGVIIVVLWLLLRTFSGVAATLAVIALSVGGALGLAGWMGVNLTPPSTASVTMIMTLAVADSIHILVTMLGEMRRGLPKHAAVIESLRVNFQPVFLTSLTTCIGFLSMNFSEVPPLNDLGNISAAGVALAWVLSITALPALAAILPIQVKPLSGAEKAPPLDRLGELVVARRRPLLWIGAVASVSMIALLPLNDLNDQFVDYFDESTAFRQDSDFAMEHLSGIYQIQFSLESGESGGISSPAYLAKLDEFAEWYRAQPGVVHVQTLTDTFKRLNRNMHGDRPELLPPAGQPGARCAVPAAL